MRNVAGDVTEEVARNAGDEDINGGAARRWRGGV
jgi:hypothetical protein